MRIVRAALVLCAAATSVATAQTSPQLRAAMQLSAEGRTDSARRIVAAVLARSRPGDSLYVEALYSRGRLGGSADTAERDLRRVAIEYSTSRWADDAMLQLAQLALASGNAPAALAQLARLRADYPGSELRPQAAYWAGRAAFVAGDTPSGCALLDSARAEGAGDVEFQNQVAFYRSRCTSVVSRAHPRAPPPEDAAPAPAAPAPPVTPAVAPAAPPAPDTTRRAPVDTIGRTPSRPTAPGYEVQVAASRDSAAAARIAARFTQGGLTARLVPGADGWFRVRLGPFATLPAARDAQAAARPLMAGDGEPFVVRP